MPARPIRDGANESASCAALVATVPAGIRPCCGDSDIAALPSPAQRRKASLRNAAAVRPSHAIGPVHEVEVVHGLQGQPLRRRLAQRPDHRGREIARRAGRHLRQQGPPVPPDEPLVLDNDAQRPRTPGVDEVDRAVEQQGGFDRNALRFLRGQGRACPDDDDLLRRSRRRRIWQQRRDRFAPETDFASLVPPTAASWRGPATIPRHGHLPNRSATGSTAAPDNAALDG